MWIKIRIVGNNIYLWKGCRQLEQNNRQRISKTNLIYSKIGNSSNELKLDESFTTGAWEKEPWLYGILFGME